ncbi:Fic family protein [Photobacterium atrarenae]|uniref:Fic family protein n=1 Tax=Photobacterium atrarenae TaxID=865757 RepID=A0ABY5GNQ5_9GAMM|nr:Fic family protein [Photobacterium atrarenae]UTV30980.1 Fic family protein [Photobacterium atrarenae]
MKENPIGYEWLRRHYGLAVIERHLKSYTGGLVGTRGADTRITHNTVLQNFNIERPANENPALHAVVALKREGVEVAYFRALSTNPDFRAHVEQAVRDKPTSKWLRIVWFLCEWLSGEQLDLEDCRPVPYVKILNEDEYYTCPPVNSTRHRLKNNIIGTAAYTAIVRKTPALSAATPEQLGEKTNAVINTWDAETIARASRYLVSRETRASGEIEKESFSKSKFIRFNEALLRAGKSPLTKDNLITIQAIIKERRPETDYRLEQNWIGGSQFSVELPTARPEYVEGLMAGWFELYECLAQSEIPATVQAGILSATFVYIHPFMDGNGRLSRYIIQEALARNQILPPGLVLPVSNGILAEINSYYDTLNLISAKIEGITQYILDNHQLFIETENQDFFRDLDVTEYTTWLTNVINRVTTEILPKEIDTLQLADKLYQQLDQALDLSANELRAVVTFVLQNDGQLSRRKGKRMELSAEEVGLINEIAEEVLGD